MDGLESVLLNLDKAQAKKLCGGRIVQLKPVDLQEGQVSLRVHQATAKKLRNARRLNKGLRLSLNSNEIEASGLKEIWADIKDTAKKVGKFYQKNLKPVVGPLIRKGLEAGLHAGVVAASAAQPELAPGLIALDKAYNKKLVDVIGKETGGFGLKRGRGAANYSNQIMLDSPSQAPVILPSPGGLSGSNVHVVHHIYHDRLLGSSFRPA